MSTTTTKKEKTFINFNGDVVTAHYVNNVLTHIELVRDSDKVTEEKINPVYGLDKFEMSRAIVKNESLFLAAYTDSEKALDIFLKTASECYKDKHVSIEENCNNDIAMDLITDVFLILCTTSCGWLLIVQRI